MTRRVLTCSMIYSVDVIQTCMREPAPPTGADTHIYARVWRARRRYIAVGAPRPPAAVCGRSARRPAAIADRPSMLRQSPCWTNHSPLRCA